MDAYDAIVVGGGLAGLAAARDLGRAGRRVLVVEARDRLGGRAWVRRLEGSSIEVDVGGTWVLPDRHPAIMAELARYGIATLATPAPARFVNVLDGEPFAEDELPPAELDDLHARARAVGAARPDATLAEALAAPGIGPRARAYATAYARYLMGADPCDVAAGAMLADDAGFAAPDHYDRRIAGGTRSLVEALAADAAVDLRLRVAVRAVEQDASAVVVQLADGARIAARAAVVALPVNTWRDVRFAPRLGDVKQALAADGHAGSSVKVWAIATGVPGIVRGLCDVGPLAYLRTERELPGGRSLLVGFGPEPSFHPTDRDAVERALRRLLPDAVVVLADGHDWNGDPHARGTWMAHRPGQLDLLTRGAGAREGRLVFAGGDLSPTAPGTLEGAVATGRAAAQEVAALLDAG